MVPVAGSWNEKIIIRRSFSIGGIVQGVGFRPFVFRLAHKFRLTGWVRNTPSGVEIEVQGQESEMAAFERALTLEAPPLAAISSISSIKIPASECHDFVILPSAGGVSAIQVAPDSALCADCLKELFDPADRRHRYPFITCTNCGPRYSIITGIPYDRPKTTMAGFPMCPDCLREYHDPADRRFHAQPNACPVCGPQVQLLDNRGNTLSVKDKAVDSAVALLKQGRILAVKGIGGYHLAVNACDHDAVKLLRERKKRDEKPFAVMAADLAIARKLAVLNEMEERLLAGPESPIVIVRKSADCPLSPLVAPNNGWLGLMLPYAPLHHLLLKAGTGDEGPVDGVNSPVPGPRSPVPALVMTSANISDEPICFEDADALERLAGIADYFLVHDRPIHIRSDDSVMRVFQGKPLFYRRSRGYAPRAVKLPFHVPPILAVGAELKGAVCLASRDQAFLSQHIGDLQHSSISDAFRHTIDHMTEILAIKPELVACDLHPDYLSSIHAAQAGPPVVSVQHHHAHMAACMAENALEGDAIGIIFDGTGYGSDGTIWGGEFLVGGYDGFRRAGHFRPVALPGGDAAVREPWRMALAYLHQSLGKPAFSLRHPVAEHLNDQERDLFAAMLEKGLNSPLTSSCGRLFDAVAALLNVRHTVSYDGQAAIELEALAETVGDQTAYPFAIIEVAPLQLDFTPMFPLILSDLDNGVTPAVIARRFHTTVSAASVEACAGIAAGCGLDRVILSGGVFQNRLLSEMVYTALTARGFQVFTHRLAPPNDGGIALGQAAIAGYQIRRSN